MKSKSENNISTFTLMKEEQEKTKIKKQKEIQQFIMIKIMKKKKK